MTNIESLTRRFFAYHLRGEQVKYNYRPNFLKNPNTGKNLELDIYYPLLRLAIEADGFTHKVLPSQKKRDRIKTSLCRKKGITLIRVTHPCHLLRKGMKPVLNRFLISPEGTPHSLKVSMRKYKPKKNHKFGMYIKRKARVEKCASVQQKEWDFLAKKNKIKNQ